MFKVLLCGMKDGVEMPYVVGDDGYLAMSTCNRSMAYAGLMYLYHSSDSLDKDGIVDFLIKTPEELTVFTIETSAFSNALCFLYEDVAYSSLGEEQAYYNMLRNNKNFSGVKVYKNPTIFSLGKQIDSGLVSSGFIILERWVLLPLKSYLFRCVAPIEKTYVGNRIHWHKYEGDLRGNLKM